MDMEGPLSLGIKVSIVGTMVASVGPPLVCSVLAAMCAVAMVPLEPRLVIPVEGIPIMMGGKDIVPPPTIPLWKGYGCTQAMGLEGEMNKVGSDW